MITAAWMIALTLIVMNIAATVVVICSGFFEPRQIRMQMAVIWLLPILGALLVSIFVWSQHDRTPRTASDVVHEDWQNAPGEHGVGPHAP